MPLTKVINNPITPDDAVNISKSNELRCLYLGVLEEHKGINLLIKTFKKLDSEKFRLKIAGRGILSQQTKNISLTMSNVSFEGEFDREIEKKLFINTDLLIVPSLCFENSPMVIYEAMQNGIPTLASRIGGIPEIITDQENGYLFQTGNPEELKNKLEYLYENKNLIEDMRQICINKSKEFNISNYIEKILEFSKNSNS